MPLFAGYEGLDGGGGEGGGGAGILKMFRLRR